MVQRNLVKVCEVRGQVSEQEGRMMEIRYVKLNGVNIEVEVGKLSAVEGI